MSKRLFFICPTDFLETLINQTFEGENYFVTSLGNSVAFDIDQVTEIQALIEAKGIKEINFILSDDNRIVLDAFGNQEFSNIKGLSNFYDQITVQKKYSLFLWQTDDLCNTILSNHLNHKIRELQLKLSHWFVGGIKLNIKIFCRQKQIFSEIHNDLFNLEISLN